MELNNQSNDIKEESKKTISKSNFQKLKGIYFIRKIFDNLGKKKTFDIIKYNKNIQNILKII